MILCRICYLTSYCQTHICDDAEQVSSAFWLLHSDIHDASTNAAIEYMSSIVASVEGATQLKSGQGGLLEQNLRKAKLRVRLKRRNGRVRVMVFSFLDKMLHRYRIQWSRSPFC